MPYTRKRNTTYSRGTGGSKPGPGGSKKKSNRSKTHGAGFSGLTSYVGGIRNTRNMAEREDAFMRRLFQDMRKGGSRIAR